VKGGHTPASRCRLVDLPRFTDARGSLSVVERADLPFPVQRFYYLYDVPEGIVRGGHAHRTEEELILALAGRLSVAVDDGTERREFMLDRPDLGLYLPALVWHELRNFSPGAVCGVLASQPYDKDDYFNAYGSFLAYLSRP
jgi:dTDP-4-dehydrorhamnose 3,5-epimerase-like enzyme